MSVLQFVDQVPEEDIVKSPLTFILSDWLPAEPLKTTSLKSLLAPVPPENTFELLSKVTVPERDIKLPLFVQSPPTAISWLLVLASNVPLVMVRSPLTSKLASSVDVPD